MSAPYPPRARRAKASAALTRARKILGTPDTFGMPWGTRYRFNHAIFVDKTDPRGFHVFQEDSPKPTKLGVAHSLENAMLIAIKKADLEMTHRAFGRPTHTTSRPFRDLSRRDSSGSHVYRLNIQPLEKEPHEHVELYRSSDPLAIAWNGGYIVIAYRYGKELTRFIPTRPMLKRLMNEVPGSITITKQMIERARLIASKYGR